MSKFKLIQDDKELYRAIYTFLDMRGLKMSGGCIDTDGTVYMGVDPNYGQATYGSLCKDLKKFLEAKTLILNGHMY